MYSAVIFDFNGVLFWDNALHDIAWRDVSTRLRGRPLTDEEMTHHVHGKVNRDIFSYVLGRPIDGTELLAMAEEKESIYRDLCLQSGAALTLSPGAVDLLNWLRDANIPRTIATSSGWSNVDFYINHLNLGRWFDLSLLVYDRGRYPGKPAPDIYREAVAMLGAIPEHCIVVEDALAGIASAHAAGIGHIIGLGPVPRQNELRALIGVAETITDLREFPRTLLRQEVVL